MIEDVYPLTPLQEGIYFHWLQSPDSPVYFEQYSYNLIGRLEIDHLRQSFQLLVSRHAILRTFFTHELAEKTLQVVKKEVDLEMNYIDASIAAEFSLKEFRESDRNEAFNLNEVSPIRLSLIKLDDNIHEFVWSFHHILMDGWCLRLLFQEFFQIYSSKIKRNKPMLKNVYPYSNYIKWLNDVNQNESINYWKSYLSGYEGYVFTDKCDHLETDIENAFKTETLEIGGSLKKSIITLCSDLEITESVFFQSVWSILLKIFSNSNDILFGSVVSGRPAEVIGIKDMIGLFINTIPVRVKFSKDITFEQLVKTVMNDFINGLKHHYIELSEIQFNKKNDKKIFDHIMVFENYPNQEIEFHN